MDINEFDELKMYFKEDYIINDKITIHQPTIGEIVEFGEEKYFRAVNILCSIPSDMKSLLYDNGIDYMEIDDFDFFILISRNLTPETTRLLLGDLDLSRFIPCIDKTNNNIVLYDEVTNTTIDKLIYLRMVGYLRKLHGIKPKIERAANKTTKRILIELDREKKKRSLNTPFKSYLKEYISAMMRYPGFKYKSTELKECGYYEFMDTVQGAQIYVQSIALLNGAYSGMIDTSKINKKELNWMRSVSDN